MTLETKMRALAQRDEALAELLTSTTTPPIFRWFDQRIEPGQVALGPCVAVTRISTASAYAMAGPLATEWPRVQIDCGATTPGLAAIAAACVIQWLRTVNFLDAGQFDSPPVAAKNFPNFQLNQRAGLQQQTGRPVYFVHLDYRVANNTNW